MSSVNDPRSHDCITWSVRNHKAESGFGTGVIVPLMFGTEMVSAGGGVDPVTNPRRP